MAGQDDFVIQFDSTQKHFYWCGHPLQSPLQISTSGEELVINGIKARSLPRDTTGSEMRLAPKFSKVPYIERRHRAGMSYLEAGNEFGLVMAAAFDSAESAYLLALPKGPTAANAAAVAALDSGLVDLSKPVIIEKTFTRMTFRGLGEQTKSRPPLRTLKPGTPSSQSKRDRMRFRVRGLRGQLEMPGPALILVDATGESMITGPAATEIHDQLQALIRATRRDGKPPKGARVAKILERDVRLVIDAALRDSL